MFALIYDEYDLSKPRKKVISVHRRRDTAEKALDQRMKKLGKRVWECNTRIVWANVDVAAGDFIKGVRVRKFPMVSVIRIRTDLSMERKRYDCQKNVIPDRYLTLP